MKMEFNDFGKMSLSFNPSSVPIKWKRFVSAKSSLNNVESSPHKHDATSQECGTSVSNYYVNIINDKDEKTSYDSDEDIYVCEEVTHTTKKSDGNTGKIRFIDQSVVHKAMKFAQFDDVQNLKRLIDSGVNVNTTDKYGWSLLMVASFAGSEKVVKYLLSKNARRGRRDCKGNTALILANRNNHTSILNLLIKNKKPHLSTFDHGISSVSVTDDGNISSSSSYFCKECNLTPKCSKKKHETSIAHLFKVGSQDAKPVYGIPRGNIGFQMLLQQGWNDYQGLGPSGAGRKYPIKTKQKKDRLGIGESAKVFKRSDSSSEGGERVEKHRLLSLKAAKKSLRNEKQREKNIRRLLNEPDT